MSDAEDGTAGLLLDRVFRRAPGLRGPEETIPDEHALVAYLSGALSPADAARVARGLVTHPASRKHLRVVAERLDVLRDAPWSVLEGAAQDGDAVAVAWRALAASRLEAAPTARGHWLAAGWAGVRDRAAAGAVDAQAAWAVFLSFADRWDRVRHLPTLAVARGTGEPVIPESFPIGVVVTLEAEIEADGALTARLSVRDQAGGRPTPRLDGRLVWLALKADGDEWPLAEVPVADDRASWRLSGVGTDLGLPPGPLPAGSFAVFLDGPAPATPQTPHALIAANGGDDSQVDLWGQPVRQGGRLRLVLSLPAPTRAAHAGRLLAVSAAVAPGLTQRLGAWPVSGWDEKPRSLEAVCPGPDGDLDPAGLEFAFVRKEPV